MGQPDGPDQERHAGYYWLAFCAFGMVSSLALYGVVLEYATSGGRRLHELSFVFATTTVYTLTAAIAKFVFGEESAQIPKKQMLVLSFTSMASSWTSVRSLRYVIYPVQVLFKSCKPVPVMFFGVVLGKKYPLKKYVNVIIITCGVALFMGGGSSSKSSSGDDSMSGLDETLLGVIMLSLSLCFDGATGAYEDKLMGNDHIGPFDLMYNIQLGKAVISFCILVATNQLSQFLETVHNGGIMLLMLGLTGALGQVFVFVTISKFGALNCALIGLGRKILTLALSFYLYGHTMNAVQVVGLSLSITSMVANFLDKGGKKKPDAAAVEPRSKAAQYEVDYQEEEGENAEQDAQPLLVGAGGSQIVQMELTGSDAHTPPRKVDVPLVDILANTPTPPKKTKTARGGGGSTMV